jgi:hypothetical protein
LSFIGYKEQVLKPVYGKNMEIEMESDASAMEEVVVNGFLPVRSRHLPVLPRLILQKIS